MATGVNSGSQMTEVWEIIVLGGCPVTLTLRNQASCPRPQWAPPPPRSLWSHGLQPSQRPCSLPPADQNEVGYRSGSHFRWLPACLVLLPPGISYITLGACGLPHLKWPRTGDSQSCVEAAWVPFCEGLRPPEEEIQVLDWPARGGRRRVSKCEKCLEILLPDAVTLCVA